ncbi:uncharacterized protein LOC123544923 [Mercenaria mercenaria]|uniref:uncharacterized protein LOC123544923 n=1 Tax=Mercenaria mercenaria TaxID=6596 RepID=UPI00234F97B6|nr:uncharacterized protein LOC123544923 [Mercenaria mercenaria]
MKRNMQGVFSVNVQLQNLTRQQVAYVHNKVCQKGYQIDDYILKSSKSVRYIIQMLLRLPLVFAIHYWLLLGPYSESSVFEILWFIARMFVVYTMARAWIFNTKTLLLQYGSIFLEICIGVIEESLYWTFQNEADEVCHESRVVTWGDVDDVWWKPALIVVLVESIYFWLHVYMHMKFQNLDQHFNRCCSFIAFLIPFCLLMFDILPSVSSSAVYYMIKVRLAVVLVTGMFKMEALDRKIDFQNLSEETEKCNFLHGEDEQKSVRRIHYLENRVKLNRNEAHIMNSFTSNRGVRDLLLIFGVLYFVSALILELFWYQTANVSDFGSPYFIAKFLLNWSTTVVPVITVTSLLGRIETVVTGFAVWLVSWDVNIINAINMNSGVVAQYTFATLLLESGIPSTNTNLDVEGLCIIVCLIVYYTLVQAIDLVGRKILEMSNRGARLAVWFYFRVLITLILLAVVPMIALVLLADQLVKDPWILYFSSGSIILISNVLFFVIEWLIVSFTWYTDQYLNVLEKSIQYTQVAKQFSYLLLLPLQFYARYYIPAFRAWWMFRAGNSIFNYIFLVILFISQQKRIYDDRKKLLKLLNSLSDVSYTNISSNGQTNRVCSICFSTLDVGKALPCTHTFHEECLRQWFQVRIVCPTCNSQVQ